MIVSYGRSCPPGMLPVYSVDDEEEARALLTLACPTNSAGQYVAEELEGEQSIKNLERFARRLERCHEILRKNDGRFRKE